MMYYILRKYKVREIAILFDNEVKDDTRYPERYKDDIMKNVLQRPPGNKGFLQFRLVAPIPKSEKNPITMLPRLTLRAVQNAAGDYGFGSSDLFILGIVQQWAAGRWGIGPQINFPAKEGFGSKEWGYGLAGALTQRALDDKMFIALLLQQT